MKMIVVFEKAPRLRHIGHLDLMRAMQRALRRSGLPLRYSQGFNPHILLTFAAPLSVGMPGRREIMEVPIEGEMSGEDFLKKLQKALPPDLPCLSARPVEDTHPAPMALLTAALYEARFDETPPDFADTVARYLAQPEIPAVRKTKSGEKPCDLKPMIHLLRVMGDSLAMGLALSEKATCKPDLLLSSLFSFAGREKPRALVTRLQLLGEKDGVLTPLETL